MEFLGPRVNNASPTGDTPLIHAIKFANTNNKVHAQHLKAIIESPYTGITELHTPQNGASLIMMKMLINPITL